MSINKRMPSAVPHEASPRVDNDSSARPCVPEDSSNHRSSSGRAPAGLSTTEAAVAQLEALRAELDSVDIRLRETLRERLDCCARIGRLKRDGAIPMMQPQRIGIVQQRAAAFAAEHGISSTFLRAFYDLIIAETCRIEDEIIAAKRAAG